MAGRWAYSNGGKDVCVYFEGFLVHAGGQCWVEALGQAQCNRVAVGDDWYVSGVRLEGLEGANT